MLVDHDLSGLVVGLTLATRPEDVYRALLEATAFGTRTIVEAFDGRRRPGQGARRRRRAAEEPAADADLRRRHQPAALDHRRPTQGPALGSAIHAAVAAGEYPDVHAAAEAMGRLDRGRYVPIPANVEAYDALYAEYRTLHDYFGRGANEVMHRLKARRREVRSQARRRSRMSVTDRRHRDPPRPARAGRRPARRAHPLRPGRLDRRQRLGPGARPRPAWSSSPPASPTTSSTPRRWWSSTCDGDLVEGDRAPSSDTAAHAYVYRHMPEVGGVVHTHSTYATAWAARGEPIPCVLTMIADEFGGDIPVGPFALIGDDSIGRGIVETLRGSRSKAVLMQNHGPFTVGKDARAAVKAAVMLEDVARTVHVARQLGEPIPIAQADVDALYDRYQNVYGQHATTSPRSLVTDRHQPRDLVPHRQPGPVRRGRAAPGRRPVARRSPTCSTRPPTIPAAVVAKPVLTDAAAIRRVMLDGQRRRRVRRRHRVDAHVLPGEDVDRRARRAAQAAAAPAHAGQRRAALGRPSTWTS